MSPSRAAGRAAYKAAQHATLVRSAELGESEPAEVLPVTPAPDVSAEQMAQQLAHDPEFEQWAFELRMGLLW